MANKKNWLGMLVMVLVFSVTVVGCNKSTSGGSSSGGGSKITEKNLIGVWELEEVVGEVEWSRKYEFFDYNNRLVIDGYEASWELKDGNSFINMWGEKVDIDLSEKNTLLTIYHHSHNSENPAYGMYRKK